MEQPTRKTKCRRPRTANICKLGELGCEQPRRTEKEADNQDAATLGELGCEQPRKDTDVREMLDNLISQMKKRRRTDDGAPPTVEEMETAARGLYAWLAKEESPLRQMLEVLGADASLYTASAAEKCARAWISEMVISQGAFVRDAESRIAPRTFGTD